MPNAARITDFHACPMVNPGPVPHVGGPVSSGSPNVNIGFIPAARVGDSAVCVPATDKITKGSANVFINRKPAARIGDATAHGGVIVVGCPTVNIGDSPQSFALKMAAQTGAPFCEECERLARAEGELRRPPPPELPPFPSATLSDADGDEPAFDAPAEELAQQTDEGPDDPLAPVRRQARELVAWGALGSLPGQTPAQVEAMVRTFDTGRPLSVVERTPGVRSLVGVGIDGGPRVVSLTSPDGGVPG
ncbi:MAG: PAAR domain-containing protein [Myxococcota bacterium]